MNRTWDNIRRRAAHRRRRAARGFTMVELLIGMIMLVMIMTAAALAMRGAANANQYGMDKSRSLQQASLTLQRISSDIRGAEDIQLTEPGCLDLVMPDGQWRRYRWTPVAGSPLVFRSDLNPLGNTLIGDVVEFNVQTVMSWSDIKQAVVPIYVRVAIEARQGTASTRLETMIRPRRNIL